MIFSLNFQRPKKHKCKNLISSFIVLGTFALNNTATANEYSKCLNAELSGQYQLAIMSCERAAASGVKEALFALGRIYRDHLADDERSFHAFKSAAIKGDPFAQYEVGLIYLHGNSYIHPDQEKAKEWFISSHNNHSFGDAAYELYKISSSSEDALRWLNSAVLAGNSEAVLELSKAYRNGLLGLTVDSLKSEELLSLAKSFESKEAL